MQGDGTTRINPFSETNQDATHRLSGTMSSSPISRPFIPLPPLRFTADAPHLVLFKSQDSASRFITVGQNQAADASNDKPTFSPIQKIGRSPDLGLEWCVSFSKGDREISGDEHLAGIVSMCMEFAAKLLKSENNGLTLDEIAAINLYTAESSFYSILNARMMNSNRDLLEPFLPYIRLLLKGLYKLPTTGTTTLYRGIRKDLMHVYKPGFEFPWWAFTSTTDRIDIVEQFLSSGEQQGTLFAIKVFSGVDISRYSYTPAECEILLLPGTRLRVKSVVASRRIVQLEEVPHANPIEDFPRPAPRPSPVAAESITRYYGNINRSGTRVSFDAANIDLDEVRQKVQRHFNRMVSSFPVETDRQGKVHAIMFSEVEKAREFVEVELPHCFNGGACTYSRNGTPVCNFY